MHMVCGHFVPMFINKMAAGRHFRVFSPVMTKCIYNYISSRKISNISFDYVIIAENKRYHGAIYRWTRL